MATIQDLIQQLNDGSQNSQNADDIEASLGLDSGRTAEPTRNLIREAILDNNIPIGSNSNGYFLIDSEDELKSVLQSLKSRIEGLKERIDSLEEGWKRREESRDDGNNWPK
ncbi:hypothetical protein [Fodinibius sp. Rm-B-1B1-1]|uniref:hypothetical protein n=1 Tax=Fodinibius alkaliphilus TaxID=3140241 RepID=UPI00315A48D7